MKSTETKKNKEVNQELLEYKRKDMRKQYFFNQDCIKCISYYLNNNNCIEDLESIQLYDIREEMIENNKQIEYMYKCIFNKNILKPEQLL